jgi:hypothetical protein
MAYGLTRAGGEASCYAGCVALARPSSRSHESDRQPPLAARTGYSVLTLEVTK